MMRLAVSSRAQAGVPNFSRPGFWTGILQVASCAFLQWCNDRGRYVYRVVGCWFVPKSRVLACTTCGCAGKADFQPVCGFCAWCDGPRGMVFQLNLNCLRARAGTGAFVTFQYQ